MRLFDEVFSQMALLLLLRMVEEGLRSVAIATATAAVAGWLEDPASFVSKKNKTKVKVRPYSRNVFLSSLKKLLSTSGTK